MRIIYDALRKYQLVRAVKFQRKNIITTLLVLTCIFTIAAAFTTSGAASLNLPILGQKAPKVQPHAASLPRLMLEGVFISDTEKLAMINHHTYQKGEHITGTQVVSNAITQLD